ncbi:glycosyltransferase family A protein [Deinococcus sp. YIM 77859]|uniref:glycosyltransferase family 2 protein n=1 Tax=Deinococcus sp. YIM 77859 TaxID=1540221 RepID=UPI0005586F96|nr:glycosyltransferase family A protein [Deinococcus sp. YIM 77859]
MTLHPSPRVSVLMPTYRQAHFLPRAVESLLAQSLSDWELIVVDDGSPDHTGEVVQSYLADPRISYHRLERNVGLGAALNHALSFAQAPLVAYLPSDDVYYRDHLAQLADTLAAYPEAALAYSGVRHHYNRTAAGQIGGFSLQLVQVMHRRSGDRWLERSELTTDDLGRMYWHALERRGPAVGTERVTCEWVDHPEQRHKIVREPVGGINTYRDYYGVQEPLRFHTTVGHFIDEVERYRRYRERPPTPPAPGGLKILLVGELAYNPERVLALAEQGHRLYGLWMEKPYWYNWTGPLPFGHVQDIGRTNWQAAVREIKPDVIYGLLNWQAVPFVHHVLTENPGVPFVWHFKEGPFICLEKGTWRELLELYARADGRIYSSREMQDWFEMLSPQLADGRPTLVLDGDLPKRESVGGERSPRLSNSDGELHTVVPGRPIGLHPETVAELAAQGIHLHFYGEFTHGQWQGWIERTKRLAGRFLHLHPNVNQENWVAEFSRYDAGWLHFFRSENAGELRRANWDDLNIPARMATLAAAGVPMLQGDNTGHIVATQSLARELDLGLFFRDMADLGAQLEDRERLTRLREHVWALRDQFTFDHHVGRLITFFREVIGDIAVQTKAEAPRPSR